MLTTSRIQEHFESLEIERLRAEVKELQTRLSRLQSELIQSRQDANPHAPGPVEKSSE